jgi:hypothetical protein
MKRKVSAEFNKARKEMRAKKVKCYHCDNYATELHHIVAVEDGGTDDLENLMPLCRECHQEYTSDQTIERNKLWVELTADDDGEVMAHSKGEEPIPLGKIANVGSKQGGDEIPMADQEPIHYEYEWIVTVEIPAKSKQESKEKLTKFKSELFSRYAVTDDVWLTRIRRYDGP